MATEEEKKNQQDLNESKREELSLEQELIRILAQRQGISSETLSDQQDISNVLKDQIKQFDFQNTQKLLLRNITNDISKIAAKNYAISLDELGTSKNLKQLNADQVKLDKDLILLNQQQTELKKTDARLESEIANSIQEQIDLAIKLKGDLKDIEGTSKKINKNFSVKSFSALEDLTKSIPVLNKFSDGFTKAADASRKEAAKLVIAPGGGKGFANALKPLLAGLKALVSTLKAAMKAFFLVEFAAAIVQGDKATGDLAKSMNKTYLEANKLRGELNNIANLSGDNFVTTKGLQETLTAINGTLGTNVMLNEENLKTFTKLRETSGLTNEELMGVQSIVNATGGDLKDATGEILAQSRISSARLGVALNEKEVLKSIKNVSAATTLSLGKNPGLIADAAATAKSLGMELSKVDQIASSLLQFESSIEAELEAELLLGKSINLEKARQAALNNDLATVAKEIAKEAGTAAEFGEMNRLQQEAIAKAMNMNRDELAKTLFVQEQLLTVSGDEAKVRERRINSLIAEKGLAEAQRVLAEEGIEGLEAQASIGEQFGQSMEKLKELFVSLSPVILKIGYALIPILEKVGKLLEIAAPVIGTLSGIIVGAAVGGPIGALIGGGLGLASDLNRGDMAEDFISRPGQPIQKFRKDDIILGGTSLNPPMGTSLNPPMGTSLNPPMENSTPTISDSKIDSLINEIRNMNKRPIEVVSTLTMDGKVVAEQIGRNNSDQLGNGLNTSNYNIQ